MYNDYKGIVFYSNQHFSDVSLVLNKKFKSNSGHTVSKRRIATGVLIDNQRVNHKHKFQSDPPLTHRISKHQPVGDASIRPSITLHRICATKVSNKSR